MVQLIIFADDLTGANELAAQFAKQRIASAVILDWQEDFRTVADSFEVISVNTASRHVAPKEAQRRMEQVLEAAHQLEIPYYYKKTDSTLRGNVAVELEVLRNNVGQGKVMFAPANPSQGRTVAEGVLYVKGKPLAFSEISADPLEPAKESHIIAYLQAQQDAPYFLITHDRIHPLAADKKGSLFHEKGCYVFDTLAEDDFSQIGKQLLEDNLLHCLAGSGGVSSVLPDFIDFKKQSGSPLPQFSRRLIVNGSLNPVAQQQMQWAQSEHFPLHILDLDQLFAEESAFASYQQELMHWLTDAYQTSPLALITTPAQKISEKTSSLFANQDIVGKAGRFGKLITTLLSQAEVEVLAVFGGDTSQAILDALHQHFLEALHEILPGVALLRSLNAKPPLYLVTKPGGFGEPHVVGLIEHYFRSL